MYYLPQPDTMVVVHSILVDECDGLLLVADRERRRVLYFQLDGKRELQGEPRCSHLCFCFVCMC